jgi:filamentous hemagglutinin
VGFTEGFPVTEAVTISGVRAAGDLGQAYERAVSGMYGPAVLQWEREFWFLRDGEWVGPRRAERLADIGGRSTAIEVKFVEDWAQSPRNPLSWQGQQTWGIRMQQEMITQAQAYQAAGFPGGMIYHTNSVDLARYYSAQFRAATPSVNNFQFVITPATIVRATR